MNLEREIMRRLKLEVAALEATLHQKDRQITNAMEDKKRAIVSLALKYGTMVSSGTMELAVPMNLLSKLYEVEMVDRPESIERVFRVRRTGAPMEKEGVD